MIVSSEISKYLNRYLPKDFNELGPFYKPGTRLATTSRYVMTKLSSYKTGLPRIDEDEEWFFVASDMMLQGSAYFYLRKNYWTGIVCARCGVSLITDEKSTYTPEVYQFEHTMDVAKARLLGFNLPCSTIFVKPGPGHYAESYSKIVDELISKYPVPLYDYSSVKDVQRYDLRSSDFSFCNTPYSSTTTTSYSKILKSRLVNFLRDEDVVLLGERKSEAYAWLGCNRAAIINLTTVGDSLEPYIPSAYDMLGLFMYCSRQRGVQVLLTRGDLIKYGVPYSTLTECLVLINTCGLTLSELYHEEGCSWFGSFKSSLLLPSVPDFRNLASSFVDFFERDYNKYRVSKSVYVAIDTLSNLGNPKWRWLRYMSAKSFLITLPSFEYHKQAIIKSGPYKDRTYSRDDLSSKILAYQLKGGQLLDLSAYVYDLKTAITLFSFDEAGRPMLQNYSPYVEYTPRMDMAPSVHVITNLRSMSSLQTYISTGNLFVKMFGSKIRTSFNNAIEIGYWARAVVPQFLAGIKFEVPATFSGSTVNGVLTAPFTIDIRGRTLHLPKGYPFMVSGHLINLLASATDINLVMMTIYYNAIHDRDGVRSTINHTPENRPPFKLWHSYLDYYLSLLTYVFLSNKFLNGAVNSKRVRIAKYFLDTIAMSCPNFASGVGSATHIAEGEKFVPLIVIGSGPIPYVRNLQITVPAMRALSTVKRYSARKAFDWSESGVPKEIYDKYYPTDGPRSSCKLKELMSMFGIKLCASDVFWVVSDNPALSATIDPFQLQLLSIVPPGSSSSHYRGDVVHGNYSDIKFIESLPSTNYIYVDVGMAFSAKREVDMFINYQPLLSCLNHILLYDGVMILKYYGLQQYCSMGLLSYLSYSFESAYITKPASSRMINDEFYIVGFKYRSVPYKMYPFPDRSVLSTVIMMIDVLRRDVLKIRSSLMVTYH